MAKNWTEEEEEHIRQNFLTQTYGDLAEHFGVTTKAMESKIRRMGLKKQELLADTADPLDLIPVVEYEEPSVPEEPGASPIESIHRLERRIEVVEETKEERATRLAETRDAAEVEKARREESRAEKSVAAALKKFEAGMKKMLAGKHDAAAKDFQAILDTPPNNVGLVARARQYLETCQESKGSEPKLTSADDLYNHGVVLMNDGELEEAIDMFERAAKKAPKDDRIAYVHSIALAQQEQDEAALEMLTAAIAANEANRVYASNDPDFGELAATTEFRELTAPPTPEADDEEA